MLAADLTAQGIASANSLDPDQAQQNVGLDLRSILFDIWFYSGKNEEEKKHVLQLILR